MDLCLSQATRQACAALAILDEVDDGSLPGKVLAERLGLTTDYLSKILTPFIREGWVTSATGRTGGYRLAIHLDTRNALDAIEVSEGRVDRSRCLHGDSRNPATDPCVLHEPWTRAREALLTELELTPLGQARQSSPMKGA